MGLGTKESNNSTFLSIYGGSIVREWRKAEPKEEYIPMGKELKTRKIGKGPNEGKTVWYVEFDYVAGTIHDVSLKTGGSYGAQLVIKLKDVDEMYVLTMNIDSAPAQSFLVKMHNIDLNEEVSFEPWSMDKEAWKKLTGKTTKSGKSGMTIRQNEEKVENYFTKDDPKGMPELIIKKVRGETKVDSTDRDIFLDEELQKFIETVRKSGKASQAPAGRATTASAPGAEIDDEEPDDLPF